MPAVRLNGTTYQLPLATVESGAQATALYHQLCDAGGGLFEVLPGGYRWSDFRIDRNVPVELRFHAASLVTPDPGRPAVYINQGVPNDQAVGGRITGLRVQHWGQANGSRAVEAVNAGRWHLSDIGSAGNGNGVRFRNTGAGGRSEQNSLEHLHTGGNGAALTFWTDAGADPSFEGTRVRDVAVLGGTNGLNIGTGSSLCAVSITDFRVLATGGTTAVAQDGNIGGALIDLWVEGLRGTGNRIWALGPSAGGHNPTLSNWSGTGRVYITTIGKAWDPVAFPRQASGPGSKPLYVTIPPSYPVG